MLNYQDCWSEVEMMAVCIGCRRPILDRYVLEAAPGLLQWHTACLRCAHCGQLIYETSRTCFIRHESVYCSRDFYRLFGKNSYKLTTSNVHAIASTQCAAVSQSNQLQSSTDVHVQLSLPYSDISASPAHNLTNSSTASAATSTNISGRYRTVLTAYQLRVLRTCYAVSPRPDPATRDQLMEMTGLSARVIRVWFQNRRCKDKKKSVAISRPSLIAGFIIDTN